jgi:hypothetical protein
VQVEDALGFVDGQLQTAQSVGAPTGGGNGNREAVFGGVFDDCADAPDAAVGRLEFREVGVPDPVAFGRWVTKDLAPQYCPGFAVSAKALWQQEAAAAQRLLI